MKVDLLVAAEHRARVRMLRALDEVPARTGVLAPPLLIVQPPRTIDAPRGGR